MRSRAEPALLPCWDAPPGPLGRPPRLGRATRRARSLAAIRVGCKRQRWKQQSAAVAGVAIGLAQSPRSERLSAGLGTTAFALRPARAGLSQWRQWNRGDPRAVDAGADDRLSGAVSALLTKHLYTPARAARWTLAFDLPPCTCFQRQGGVRHSGSRLLLRVPRCPAASAWFSTATGSPVNRGLTSRSGIGARSGCDPQHE